MQILIIGAGIVGISTALKLTQEGHQVTVIDSGLAAANHASYANAGLLSPGHCFSWAEPGIGPQLFSAFIQGKDRPRINPPRNLELLQWLRRFLKQSTTENWKRNSLHALQLAQLSRNSLLNAIDIPTYDYDKTETGLLYLYQSDQNPPKTELNLLAQCNEPYQQVNQAELYQLEPHINWKSTQFSQATYCPLDASGDARLYALAGVLYGKERGVSFKWSTKAQKLILKNNRVIGVDIGSTVIPCDVCIVAAGHASKELLQPLGYQLRIHPVSGYSISYSQMPDQPLQRGGVSIADKIAWAPFGSNRLRFTGFADLGYPSPALSAYRFNLLENFAHSLLPQLAQAEGKRWIGQRPMTPDGLPYIGASAHEGLYLNCGHGAMGWTMATGSAHLLSQIISQQHPSLDIAPFRYNRDFL